jgi:hypothetical protein
LTTGSFRAITAAQEAVGNAKTEQARQDAKESTAVNAFKHAIAEIKKCAGAYGVRI